MRHRRYSADPVPRYANVIYDDGIKAKPPGAVKHANEKSCVESVSLMSSNRRRTRVPNCLAAASAAPQGLDFTRETRSFPGI